MEFDRDTITEEELALILQAGDLLREEEIAQDAVYDRTAEGHWSLW